MEKALEHEATPKRNKHRQELKQDMAGLWHSTKDGLEFLSACAVRDYIITRTAQRRSFSVVDKDGISYNLPRQIKGVRTKEVAERLAGLKLKTNKEAIQEIRTKQSDKSFQDMQEKMLDKKTKFQQEKEVKKEAATFSRVKSFANNKGDMFADQPAGLGTNQKMKESAIPKDKKEDDRKAKIASLFANNRDSGMYTNKIEEEAVKKAAEEKEEKIKEMKKKLFSFGNGNSLGS